MAASIYPSPRLVGLLVLATVGAPRARLESPTETEIRYYLDDWRYAEAEARPRALLEAAETHHGLDSAVDPNEASRLAERAVGIKEKRLGPEHSEGAYSLDNWAPRTASSVHGPLTNARSRRADACKAPTRSTARR